MRKLILYFLLFPIFIFGLLNCSKDKVPGEPTPCATCQKVTEAKDYFAFKVGSWWVYEEETTLERDSVYVTESYIDEGGYDFNVRMFSTYQDFYYHYWPTFMSNLNGCSIYSAVSKRCLFINRSKYQFGNVLGESKCFFIKYYIGDFIYSGSDMTYCPDNKVIFENIYNEFVIDTFNFSKTIKIHELCSYIDGKQPTNYYYSKGIGIIKKEFLDSNQVWNLVNYHIEP